MNPRVYISPLRKIIALTLSLCSPLTGLANISEVRAAAQEPDPPTLSWMQAVLDNWERICGHDLHTYLEPLPWIIFYDDVQAWHLMPEKHRLPAHTDLSASLTYAGRTIRLIRVAHREGKLWVPDRDPLDATRPLAFTMPYDNDKKCFFIAPVPTLYRRLGRAEQSHDLDELFFGATAHELTHTRQMVYAAQQIAFLRARAKLPASIDDNIIEREFAVNEDYKRLFDEEHKLLPSAVMASDLADCRQKVRQILASAQRRKASFFVGNKAGYSRLEDIFLTMEGIAMWVQYRTALERAPQGEDHLKTLLKMMEAADSWSQEEGLGLFLLLDRLMPNWQRRFLAPDLPSPFTVLREVINRRPPRKIRHKGRAG